MLSFFSYFRIFLFFSLFVNADPICCMRFPKKIVAGGGSCTSSSYKDFNCDEFFVFLFSFFNGCNTSFNYYILV
ncbi:hypothetical protein ACE6H2_015604 [Prunus campanulata]